MCLKEDVSILTLQGSQMENCRDLVVCEDQKDKQHRFMFTAFFDHIYQGYQKFDYTSHRGR